MLKHNRYIHSIHKTAIKLLIIMALISCSSSEDEQIGKIATDFTSAYYNFRYNHAIALCTQESRKWIKFQASNVRQTDIDLYNNLADSAQCRINEINMIDDSTAAAIVDVQNFVMTDSIIRNGQVVNKAQLKLEMKKRGQKWLVSLTSLPSPTTTR